MFLHGDRVVRAALDRRIVGHDEALPTRHPTDARDHPRTGALVVVHAVGGERRQLEERASGVEQSVDPVTRQQLAPADVTLPRTLRTTEGSGGELLAQL